MTSNVTTETRSISWIRRSLIRRPDSLGDGVFNGVTLLASAIVTAVIASIVIYLIVDSWPSITKFGFGFLTASYPLSGR